MAKKSIGLSDGEKAVAEGKQFENAENIYSPVEKVSYLFPDNTALRFLGKNFTYKTLRENVEKYAAALKETGLEDGEAVTFALPNIPESVYLLYAAAKANLRCSPLHPLSTPEAVRSAIEKTGSRIIFALGDAAKLIKRTCPETSIIAVSPANSLKLGRILYNIKNPLPKPAANIYTLDGFLRSPKSIKLSQIKFVCPAKSDSAILLQSGGTTGTPKVIGLSAASVNNLAAKGLGILGKEKVTDCGMMSVLPVFHGFGLAMGVHAMLCHGGKNVLFPKFHRASAIKEIAKGNIQFMIGVPRIYEALLSHPSFGGKMLNHLSVAFVGGDFVPRTLLHKFDRHIISHGGNCRLFEGYGLTETVTVCAVNTYKANKDETVGKPLENIEIAAFDFSAAPYKKLESGLRGELAVTGDTLMSEYLSDETATENVFFMYDGKKYVRTGDCGYTDNDGFVHFVSRIKRIIKIAGVPVYPLEIEQLVCEQKGITAACVMPVKQEGNEDKIALFVEGGEGWTDETLKTLIGEKISVYAVPETVIFEKLFPRTNVSKIDSAKLMKKHSL